jgi:hypothetical protein
MPSTTGYNKSNNQCIAIKKKKTRENKEFCYLSDAIA